MADPAAKSFGPFRLDTATGELWKGGVRLRLQDQPARVLTLLLERPGELVTRDELRERLWPDDTHVDFDHALTTAVKKLRRVLNDSARHPRYVETLPKRGYRFVAEVDEPSVAAPDGDAVPAPPAPSSDLGSQRNRATGFAAALFAAAVVIVLGWIALREPSAPPRTVRRFSFPIEAPGSGFTRRVAISPDGTAIAYVVERPRRAIHLRELDQEEPRELAGTAGATSLFWSPDSRVLGFSTLSELRRVPREGGASTRICELPGLSFAGGAWSPDGETIVFAADLPATLFEVPALRGSPRALFEPVVIGTGGGNRDPAFLSGPDEPPVLAFAAGGPADFRVIVRRLDSGDQVELGPGRMPAWAPQERVLFQPIGPEGDIWAMPFSTRAMAPRGPAVLLAPGGVAASAARDGTLVYADPRSPPSSRLTVRDREGRVSAVLAEATEIDQPAISPDGSRVAFRAMRDRNRDIWVLDVEARTRRRISFDPVVDAQPVWSPDGASVAWRSDVKGDADVFWRALDGDPEPQPLVATESTDRPGSWTPDGGGFVFTTLGRETGNDIWLAEILDREGAFQLRPLVESHFHELSPRISPDGRLLAYCSNESGDYEVYVRPLERKGPVRQVSFGGGCQPRWTRGGRELLFVSGADLNAVAITPDGGVGKPAVLFSNPNLANPAPFADSYDVWPDGERVTLAESAQPGAGAVGPTRIHVVENAFVAPDR